MDPSSRINNFPFYNQQQQPIEQFAIKKLPNPQNYKIVKCKNFETTGSNILTIGQCKYREMCTFAHGETELRTKNENTFLVGNSSQTSNNNMNYNYSNSQPQMFVNPNNYMNFNANSQNAGEWTGDFSQMYSGQGYPFMNQMSSDNMGVNPNLINLNMNPMMMSNMNSGYLGFNAASGTKRIKVR